MPVLRQTIYSYSYLLLGLQVADCKGESLVDIPDPVIYLFLDVDNDILFLPICIVMYRKYLVVRV